MLETHKPPKYIYQCNIVGWSPGYSILFSLILVDAAGATVSAEMNELHHGTMYKAHRCQDRLFDWELQRQSVLAMLPQSSLKRP